MTQVHREGIETKLGPEQSHRLYVVRSAEVGALNALRSQLGSDVLDPEDYAAIYGPQYPTQEVPTTPVPANANNVVPFPQRPAAPAIGEMATNIITEGDAGVDNDAYLRDISTDNDYPEIVGRAA
jgi:hypothetical protein